MCHVHTNEEMANILETLADLFSWKRRERFKEAAVVLRSPSRQWRHAATPSVPYENGFIPPDNFPVSEETSAA